MNQQIPDIDGFEIISQLGQGGMSVVYKAKQLSLNRLVAIKVLSNICKPEDLKRFLREAKLTSALNHPNIISTVTFGIDQTSNPYLVLEYLEGHSLRTDLSLNAPYSFKAFGDIFLPVLEALNYAHREGVIHRDLKPENIMLSRDSNGVSGVKILDFGIAKMYDGESTVTAKDSILGTPNYISPELCSSSAKIDGRADLYSLCCVMYETFALKPPFEGNSPFEVMHKHLTETPPTVAELIKKVAIPPALAKAILSGLQKDVEKRPQTAAELSSAIREALAELTADRVPLPRSPEGSPSTKNLSIMGIALGACFSAVALFLVLTQLQQTTKLPDPPQKPKVDVGADVDKVRNYANGGKFEAALQILQNALKRDRTDKSITQSQRDLIYLTIGQTANLQALALTQEGGSEEAAKAWRVSMDNLKEGLRNAHYLAPKQHMHYLDELATAQVECKDSSGALETAKVAIILAQRSGIRPVVVTYLKGVALEQQNRWQDAMDSFLACLTLCDEEEHQRRNVSAINSTIKYFNASKALHKQHDAEVTKQIELTEKQLLTMQFRKEELRKSLQLFQQFLEKEFGQKRGQAFLSRLKALSD